ncbi:ADP-ribosylglycohydrolase family protein [Parafrankia sp. BMG5.11]|uniref:ADP-ribosylglycohydrolase family protein n=2 Tax=unclassified Parafrankia TaxID=2994368 RepID=UPI001038BA7B|nr:ADP-ribosylglycohydrolase family protein [Parafrankia sp. BMG5.11]TCJ33980.1 crystallin J1 [Parafrankia sp. BMG5.11]
MTSRGQTFAGGPAGAASAAGRIAGALTAYACGDAFGLPWEGSAPRDVDLRRAADIPARGRWERGSTSDDTALTLLVAEHLTTHGGAGDPAALMGTLADRAASIYGLGPSTIAAIDHFRAHGRPPARGGRTNGALMRALPIGWATAPEATERRRQWVRALSTITHPDPVAQAAAAVAAACASWAVEGVDGPMLLAVAAAEADALAGIASPAASDAVAGTDALAGPAALAGVDAVQSLSALVRAIERGRWAPPPAGVSLDPVETLGAVLHCVATRPTLGAALTAAIGLGGDTDTVAALTGGILGGRHTPEEIRAELPWSSRALLPPRGTIDVLADGLATLREPGPAG